MGVASEAVGPRSHEVRGFCELFLSGMIAGSVQLIRSTTREPLECDRLGSDSIGQCRMLWHD